MSEPEWVDVSELLLTADVVWLNAQSNGSSPAEAEPDSWQPLNLAEMPDTPPVEPTLGGLGLVYPGKRHVFSGPQESAKTLAAYVIGLAVVRSSKRIVLIDFEMGPWDCKTRLRELGASDEELGGISYVGPDTPSSPVRVDGLVALEPALVIVDAAAGAFELEGFDDNARKDVERWAGRWITPFWKAGIATIVLDHVTKNVDTRGSYAIGSERKVGGADVHLGFSVVHPIKRGGHGVYKITTHKDRGGFLKRGKLAEFELDSDPDTNVITWAFKAAVEADEERPFRPTVKMEQASKWLEKQLEAVPISHVEKGIGGDRDTGRLAIQILVDEGYIEETEGARNARMLLSVRAYREAFDDLSVTSPDLSGEVGLSHLSGSPLPLQGTEPGGEDEKRSGEVSSPIQDDIPF